MNDNGPGLLILAAGIGSRYRGLKQLDGMGPNNETIIEYSIYDALRAGFKKIVFVINEQYRSLFESRIVSRFPPDVSFSFVAQKLSLIPEGYAKQPNRQKPWGTGHAVLVARDAIHCPFAVINADDFYGREAFQLMADELKQKDLSSTDFSAVGYRLENTLSDFGSVSRGICEVKDGYLVNITELTEISRLKGNIISGKKDQANILSPDIIVSMNFWGFTPRVFDLLEKDFAEFLDASSGSETDEFFLPMSLDKSIHEGKSNVKVLTTSSKWMGVTNREDKESVKKGLNELIGNGCYPASLSDAMNH